MKKALLLGSYGQTNIGDDILMFNYLDLLNSYNIKDIYVNTNDENNVPKIVKSKYKNIKYINTYQSSILKWIINILKVDYIFYGGGTIFKELYSTTGRKKYSVILRIMGFNIISQIFGKKVINLHIGIGSIKTRLGEIITKLSLLSSTYTIFRDEESYKYAKDVLKIPENKIGVSTDGIFMNHSWAELKDVKSVKLNKQYKKIIGINLLHDIPDWIDRKEYINTLVSFLNYLLSNDNYLIFIPFQHKFNKNDDYNFMKNSILPYLNQSNNYTILENIEIYQISELFKKLDIFIGMRLHSFLISTITNTPFISIEYDTKCSRYISQIKYPYSIPINKLTDRYLINEYRKIVIKKRNIKEHLSKSSADNFKVGILCMDHIKSLVQ